MIVLILIAVICAPLLIMAAVNQQPPPKAPLSDFDLAAAHKKARLMVYGAMRVPSEMFRPQKMPLFTEEIAKSIRGITDALFISGDGGFAFPYVPPAIAHQPEQISPKHFADHIKACVSQLRERDPLRGIPKGHVCVIHPRWMHELERLCESATIPLFANRLDSLVGRKVLTEYRAPQDKFEFMSELEYWKRYPVIPRIEAPEFGPEEM